MTDDDAMASGIVITAILLIILWACAGCSIPGKVAGDNRPAEVTNSIVIANPIPEPEPAPYRPQLVSMSLIQPVPTTNLRKQGRFIRQRWQTQEQLDAWKKERGF